MAGDLSFAELRGDLSDETRAAELLAANDASPWYLRLLIGFSAWVATMFCLVWLVAFDLIDGSARAIGLGSAFILFAGLTRFFAPRQDFLDQILLALSLTGIACMMVGFGWEAEQMTYSFLTLFVLSLATLVFFRDVLHRIFSTLGLFAGLAGMAIASEHYNLLALVLILAGGAAAAVFLYEAALLTGPAGELVSPLSTGLALALPGLCLLSLAGGFEWAIDWRPTGIGLSLLLLVTVSVLYLRREPYSFRLPLALLLLAVPLTPLISAPGIAGALLLLVLGFSRGNRFVSGLAGLTLLLYVFYFYYNLQMPLQAKSYLLIGSGASLLLIRFAATRLLFRDAGGEP